MISAYGARGDRLRGLAERHRRGERGGLHASMCQPNDVALDYCREGRRGVIGKLPCGAIARFARPPEQ